MKEAEGNIWTTKDEVICVLINLTTLQKCGDLIMGGGQALEARQRYPTIASTWGRQITKTPSGRPTAIWLGSDPDHGRVLYPFPTKFHPAQKSSLELIDDSIRSLVIFSSVHPTFGVSIPRPGTGLGGLDWVKEVRPLLAPLDDRFTVWKRAGET